MIFRVLGPLEVYEPGGDRVELGARKPTALLTTLLLQANAWVSAERLIAAMWPERDAPPSADRNVKTYVWRVRKLLPGRVESRPGGYRIVVAPGELDAEVFRTIVAQADRELSAGQSAVDTYAAALAIWRGTPFEEVEATAAVARLAELRRHAQESLARAQLAVGRRAEAITVLRGLTADDPLRECTWANLVLALHADGRRAEALACYQQARTLLVDELGVEPGSELVAAQQQVLAGVSSEPVLSAPDTLPRDLPDFTGRASEIAAVLSACGVVQLTGMGGVGKTALAAHCAHSLAPRFPDGRLFLSLREQGLPLDVGTAVSRLLVALGVPVPDEVPDRIARWRASVAGRRVLLVLDDAEDASTVTALLPGGSGCGVLVTSRGALAVDGARTVFLDLPSDKEAAQLFRAMAGDRALAEPGAVAAVARTCGNLPLALRVAAIRLHQRPLWTVAALASRLRDPAGRDQELNGGDRNVSAVFEPAYRRLPPPHRRLFDQLAATRAPIDVATASALAHVSRAEAERTLDRLTEDHLLTETAPGRYRVHPLVADVARTPTAVVPLRGAS